MTRGRGQTGAERIQLIVQPLAQRPALVDELAAMSDRCEQSVERLVIRAAPLALAQQKDERGAVAIVRLEASRAELGARGLGLRGREQPQRPRKAPLELARQGTVKRTRRLDSDHRRPRCAAVCDQSTQAFDARARDGQRHRLADKTTIACRQPHELLDLPGIDRHCQRAPVQHAAKYGTH